MRSALALAAVLALAACADADDPTPAGSAAQDGSGVVPEARLLDRFPETLAGLPLLTSSTKTEGALGFEVSQATAMYKEGTGVDGPQVGLNLMDLGSADMAQNMGYGWGLAGVPDTTIQGYPARVEDRIGYRTAQVLVGERFLIETLTRGVDPAAVDAALATVDLEGLARLGAE